MSKTDAQSSLNWSESPKTSSITSLGNQFSPRNDVQQKAADVPASPSQTEKEQVVIPPAYTAFSPGRKRFILAITTIAGFFGPLAGGIYLPALPVLEKAFHVSATAINASVTVFMLVFAVGVSQTRVEFTLPLWC